MCYCWLTSCQWLVEFRQFIWSNWICNLEVIIPGVDRMIDLSILVVFWVQSIIFLAMRYDYRLTTHQHLAAHHGATSAASLPGKQWLGGSFHWDGPTDIVAVFTMPSPINYHEFAENCQSGKQLHLADGSKPYQNDHKSNMFSPKNWALITLPQA